MDLSKQYHILGHPNIEERDDNRDLKPDEQRPEPVVVFTTDSKDEANEICRAGYWQENEDADIIPVVGWRDSKKAAGDQTAASHSESQARPISRKDF